MGKPDEGKTAADYAANQATFQVLAGANELPKAGRPQLWDKTRARAASRATTSSRSSPTSP